jgi:hypothetical protein
MASWPAAKFYASLTNEQGMPIDPTVKPYGGGFKGGVNRFIVFRGNGVHGRPWDSATQKLCLGPKKFRTSSM